jgi:hypothetical protein
VEYSYVVFVSTRKRSESDPEVIGIGRPVDLNMRMRWVSRPEEFAQQMALRRPMVALFSHVAEKRLDGFLSVLEQMPRTQRPHSLVFWGDWEGLERFAQIGNESWVQEEGVSFFGTASSEKDVQHQIASLLAIHSAHAPASALEAGPASTSDLHNPQTGRLDIRRVAEAFDLTVSELARSIGIAPKTALRTPDSETIHRALLPFEIIARARTVLKDRESFLRWLNRPLASIGNAAPKSLLLEGKAKELAGVVNAALLGQPG